MTTTERLREQIDNPPPFTFTGNERGVVLAKDDARKLLALVDAMVAMSEHEETMPYSGDDHALHEWNMEFEKRDAAVTAALRALITTQPERAG